MWICRSSVPTRKFGHLVSLLSFRCVSCLCKLLSWSPLPPPSAATRRPPATLPNITPNLQPAPPKHRLHNTHRHSCRLTPISTQIDFRRVYGHLGEMLDAHFLQAPRLALSATATPEGRTEIIAALHLRDAKVRSAPQRAQATQHDRSPRHPQTPPPARPTQPGDRGHNHEARAQDRARAGRAGGAGAAHRGAVRRDG